MGNTFSEKHADHPAPAFIERGEPAEESITLRFNTTTLGERLIPVLLLGGEVCVGYALLVGLAASVSFAGMVEPLLPVWGLPLMMLSFYVSSRLFQRCSPTGVARKVIEPITWLPLALCLALVFVWLITTRKRSRLSRLIGCSRLYMILFLSHRRQTRRRVRGLISMLMSSRLSKQWGWL